MLAVEVVVDREEAVDVLLIAKAPLAEVLVDDAVESEVLERVADVCGAALAGPGARRQLFDRGEVDRKSARVDPAPAVERVVQHQAELTGEMGAVALAVELEDLGRDLALAIAGDQRRAERVELRRELSHLVGKRALAKEEPKLAHRGELVRAVELANDHAVVVAALKAIPRNLPRVPEHNVMQCRPLSGHRDQLEVERPVVGLRPPRQPGRCRPGPGWSLEGDRRDQRASGVALGIPHEQRDQLVVEVQRPGHDEHGRASSLRGRELDALSTSRPLHEHLRLRGQVTPLEPDRQRVAPLSRTRIRPSAEMSTVAPPGSAGPPSGVVTGFRPVISGPRSGPSCCAPGRERS